MSSTRSISPGNSHLPTTSTGKSARMLTPVHLKFWDKIKGSINWSIHALPVCINFMMSSHLSLTSSMKGNDSLKCIEHRSAAPVDDLGKPGPSCEQNDTRTVSGDLYISQEDVDNLAKGVIENIRLQLPIDVGFFFYSVFILMYIYSTQTTTLVPSNEKICMRRSPIICGVFLTRQGPLQHSAIMNLHLSSLTWCKAGNSKCLPRSYISNSWNVLSRFKYPLATFDKMLNTFAPNQGSGYNTGCQFGATLANSPLGSQAKQLNYTQLIDAFHGHAHHHLC